MKISLIISAAIAGVAAYPNLPVDSSEKFDFDRRDTPAIQISRAETNCGPVACKTFSEDQFISTTGKHAFQSPAITDIRGPCPGLNAAANHGYIPRDGILTIADTVEGMFHTFSLSREFNAFLAAYAIIMTGDLVSMKWSIGGPQPYLNPGGILTPPQGISFSHNKYEGDVSIARNDAYMNNGDAHSLDLPRFLAAFETGMSDDRYTLHRFRKAFRKNLYYSIKKNPYYFSPPFAGAAVPPAAYNFVINFMSNHTAEEPSGYLDGYNFKKFFAIKGKYPNFKWMKGQERIPDNWYKRPGSSPYGAATTVEDDAIGWAAFPDTFRVGGNTNGPNSYQGVSLSNLTGGSITDANLLEGNNAGCLIFLAAQQAIPDELKGGVNNVAAALQLFNKFGGPILKRFGCKPLKKYDSGLFDQFPGRNYDPKGEATNY